jgi:hypothetical protein
MRLYIIVLALTLSACQTTSPPPTPLPSGTPVITATPRQPTPTTEASPTAVPETAEQMHLRLAETVVAHGWSPNNEATWVTPEGMTVADKVYLTRMISINADPNTKTKEQLVSYDAFLTLVRKEQLSRDLYSADSTIAGNTNNALDKFLASGFLTAVPTQDQVVFMKVNQADFRVWLDTLTSEQVFHLERLYCNENGIEFMPSHVELWRLVDQFAQATRDGKILYASNVAIDGTKIGNSGEYNGMWMGRSRKDNFKLNTIEYPITMFGEAHNWVGNWSNDEHRYFIGGDLRLPYGRQGLFAEIWGSDGRPYHMPLIVTYNGATIPGYVDPRFANQNGVDQSLIRVDLFTRLRLDYRQEEYQPLTHIDILEAIKNRFPVIMITEGFTFANGFVGEMFFDEKTGLPIFGSPGSGVLDQSSLYIIRP